MDVTLPDGTTINNVPEGMSKAELVGKLKANGHDTSWYKEEAPKEKQPEPTFWDKIKEAGKNAAGGVEAAGAMASGLPSMVGAGLWGAASAPFQGLDKATKDMEKIQEYRYHPRTDAGKLTEEMLGAGIGKAGELGTPVIKNLIEAIPGVDKISDSAAQGFSDAFVNLAAMDLPLHAVSPKGLLKRFAKTDAKISPELVRQAEELKNVKKPVETQPFPDISEAVQETRKSPVEVPRLPEETDQPLPQLFDETPPEVPRIPGSAEEAPRPEQLSLAEEGPFAQPQSAPEPFQSKLLDPLTLQDKGVPLMEERASTPSELPAPFPERFHDLQVEPAPKDAGYVPRSQRGYIDPSIFKEGFEKARDSVVKGIKFIAKSTGVDGMPEFDGVHITAVDTATGKKVGELGLNKQDLLAKPENTNLQANDVPGVNIHPEYQGKGIAQDMYKFASELGADVVPSDRQTTAGKGFWDKMQKTGIADKTGIKSPGNKQGGAFTPFSSIKAVNPIKDFKNFTEFKKAMDKAGVGDTALEVWKKNGGQIRTADLTPEESQFANYAKNFGKNKDDAYAENRDLIKQSSDQAPNMFGRNTMPGGASMKRYLDSPAATWAINLIDGAKKEGNLRAEKNIEKVGELTKSMTTMFGSAKELHTEINNYVKGLSAKTDMGQRLHDGLKKMFDDVYEPLNEAYKQKQIDGGTLPENVKTLPKLDNYFPHMWEGPFGFKIVDPESGRVLTVVREKNVYAVEKARKYVTAQLEAKGQAHQFEIGPTEYNKLLDNSKFQQDVGLVSQQFMEALDLMADSKDPIVQHKMSLLDSAMKREAWNSASGFKKHTENRIGVTGWKGNKPWESEAVNAKDAIEVTHKYFRDAHTFIESQRANKELREFYKDNPDKPNTAEYVEQAYKQAFVGLENKLGPVMAKLQDAYSNTTGFSAGSAKNFVRSIKSVVTAATLTSTRNAIAQIVQAPQSLVSELVRNKQMEGGPTSVGTALVTGLVHSVLYPANKAIEMVSGKPEVLGSVKAKEITRYMLDNGITDTYAMDAAYHHSPSMVKSGMDRVMGVGLRLPDQIGRVWTFTSLVKSFEEVGFPLKDAMDKSRDLTDVIMNSGAKHNQAPIYQKLGMVGELAGNVQSFKHNTLTQLAYDVKAVKNKDPGAQAALVTKLSGVLATSGVIGMVGVAEADQLVKLLKKFIGTPDVINTPGVKESIYTMLPPELSMGILSSSTDVDFAGTFSSPQLVNDNLTDMIWPLGGRALQMGQGLAQVGSGLATGNKYAQIAGTAQAAPDIPLLKGFLEKKMSTPGKDGNILVERPNSGNRTVVNRTPEQQTKRMWGLTDLNESMDRKLGYEVQQDETLRRGAQKDIVNQIPEVFAENTINKQLGVEWKSRLKDLQMKYLQLGGDPDKFVGAAIVAAKGRASRSQMVSMLRINAKDMESLQKNKRIMDRFKSMQDSE